MFLRVRHGGLIWRCIIRNVSSFAARPSADDHIHKAGTREQHDASHLPCKNVAQEVSLKDSKAVNRIRTYNTFAETEENFFTPMQKEYFERLMKGIDTRDLVLGGVTLVDLKRGLSFASDDEIEEVHSEAMQYAEDSVELGGLPYTSKIGVEAIDMIRSLASILRVPSHMIPLMIRLHNEVDVGRPHDGRAQPPPSNMDCNSDDHVNQLGTREQLDISHSPYDNVAQESSQDFKPANSKRSYNNCAEAQGKFCTPMQAEYFERLVKAIDTRDLVLGRATLVDLKQGLSFASDDETEEIHSEAMQYAEDSVDLGGLPYTSKKGVEAINMVRHLASILRVPCHMIALTIRLHNEVEVGQPPSNAT